MNHDASSNDDAQPEDARTPSRRRLITAAALAGAAALTPATAFAATGQGSAEANSSSTERRNRAAVLRAFQRQNSGGSVFDILHDDVKWTIVNGSTFTSKARFLAEGAAPITTRLASPIVMTVRELWTNDDIVIIHFDGHASALDGQPYRNEYCWIWQLRNEKVVRCNAFLDTVAIRDLIERVDVR